MHLTEQEKLEITDEQAKRQQQIILNRHAMAVQRQDERWAELTEQERQENLAIKKIRQEEAVLRQKIKYAESPKSRFYLTPEAEELWEWAREDLMGKHPEWARHRRNTNNAFAFLLEFYGKYPVNPCLAASPVSDTEIQSATFVWLRLPEPVKAQWEGVLTDLCEKHPSFQNKRLSRALKMQAMSYLLELYLDKATAP